MEALFLSVLNMSITASWIILAVLAIRLLLKRAPKKYSYALWSVVAFRLCCPISFRSVFSVLNVLNFGKGHSAGQTAQPLTPSASSAVQAGVQSSGEMVYVPSDIGFARQPEVHIGSEAVSEVISGSLPPASPMTSINPMQILLFLAAVIWCIGMAALVLYSVISWLRLRHRLRKATLLAENVWQSEQVGSPFILGIVKPKIYIPYHLDGDTLRYVLDHERYHIRHGDHLLRLFAYLLLTLHWFNPLCWLAFHLMGKDMEMRCDEAVLTREGGRADYSSALLSFAVNRRFPSAGPLAFGESGLKSRIRNILRWKKPRMWVTVAAVILCLAALLACAANPKGENAETPKPPEASEDAEVSSGQDADTYTVNIAGRNDLRFIAYGDALWAVFGAENLPWTEASEILVTDAIRPRLEAVFQGKTARASEEIPANINVMEVSTGECQLWIDDSGFVTLNAGSFRGYFELNEAELDTLYTLIREGYGVDPNAMAPLALTEKQNMTVTTYRTGVKAVGYSLDGYPNVDSRELAVTPEMVARLNGVMNGKIPQKVEAAPGGLTLMKFTSGDWSMTVRGDVAYVLEGTQGGTIRLSDGERESLTQFAYDCYIGTYEFGQFSIGTAEWQTAVEQYLRFMNEKLPSYDPSSREPYDFIDLADLDFSGVPELILYSYGAEVWNMTVLTIEDGTVCSLTPSEAAVKYEIPLSRNAVSERMYGVCPYMFTAEDWVDRGWSKPNCFPIQYWNGWEGESWMLLSQKGHWMMGLSEWSEEYTAWRFVNRDGYLAAEQLFWWYREGNEDGPTHYETAENTGLAAEVEILRWQQAMAEQYSPVFEYPYGIAAAQYGLE